MRSLETWQNYHIYVTDMKEDKICCSIKFQKYSKIFKHSNEDTAQGIDGGSDMQTFPF